jgi:hypothetical protein
MLENLPAKAVLKVVAAERRMIEDDLNNKRVALDHEVTSVLAMCQFLEAAAEGRTIALPGMMMGEWTSCEGVIRKLVAAGELPKSIETYFDTAFFTVVEHAFT